MLTPEKMEQEATAVANDIAALIEAGMDPDASITEKISILVAAGYQTFGDVQAGIDEDANKLRFGLLVGAKVGEAMVQRLLPLLESEAPTEG